MFSPDTPSYFLTPDYHASAGTQCPVIDPATMGLVGHYKMTTDAERIQVLTAVNIAQSGWKKLDAKTRAAHLHRLAYRRISCLSIFRSC